MRIFFARPGPRADLPCRHSPGAWPPGGRGVAAAEPQNATTRPGLDHRRATCRPRAARVMLSRERGTADRGTPVECQRSPCRASGTDNELTGHCVLPACLAQSVSRTWRVGHTKCMKRRGSRCNIATGQWSTYRHRVGVQRRHESFHASPSPGRRTLTAPGTHPTSSADALERLGVLRLWRSAGMSQKW